MVNICICLKLKLMWEYDAWCHHCLCIFNYPFATYKSAHCTLRAHWVRQKAIRSQALINITPLATPNYRTTRWRRSIRWGMEKSGGKILLKLPVAGLQPGSTSRRPAARHHSTAHLITSGRPPARIPQTPSAPHPPSLRLVRGKRAAMMPQLWLQSWTYFIMFVVNFGSSLV